MGGERCEKLFFSTSPQLILYKRREKTTSPIKLFVLKNGV